MVNSRSKARLRSASTELAVSSTITAPRTSSPTQIGCAAETITARPSGVGRRSVVRMPASAPATSRASCSVVPALSSAKFSVGWVSTSEYSGLGRRRRRVQRARAREDVEIAVDHPDACGGPRHPLQDLRDFGHRARVRNRPLRRRRRPGQLRRFVHRALGCQRLERHRREIEQPRAVVQRRRDRLRRAAERSLLGVAQHALQFAHVTPSEKRDDQEHRQHEQQLGTYAEREARALHCSSETQR